METLIVKYIKTDNIMEPYFLKEKVLKEKIRVSRLKYKDILMYFG